MHAVVKTENGKFRVLQVGLRNILTPVEGTVLVPVEDPRDIRPVVVVEDGVVTETYPGIGRPVVVDLDESPDTAYYAVGVDEAEIVDTTRSLRKALEIARKALKTATWKVDLELQDAHRDILAIYTLYERRLP